MLTDIADELREAEAALWNMQGKYADIARTAAEAQYVFEMAWADAMDEQRHRAITQGIKPPTVSAMEAIATQRCKDEIKVKAIALADLDAAKKQIDVLQSILSSVQTRAKLMLADAQFSGSKYTVG